MYLVVYTRLDTNALHAMEVYTCRWRRFWWSGGSKKHWRHKAACVLFEYIYTQHKRRFDWVPGSIVDDAARLRRI